VVCGGLIAQPDVLTVSEECWRYNFEGNGSWEQIASMATKRYTAAGIDLDDGDFWITGESLV
jgi:hypothetical protein